jgi:hypothetical protein
MLGLKIKYINFGFLSYVSAKNKIYEFWIPKLF